MVDPTNVFLLDEVKRRTPQAAQGLRDHLGRPRQASSSRHRGWHRRCQGRRDHQGHRRGRRPGRPGRPRTTSPTWRRWAASRPSSASSTTSSSTPIKQGASDIHIEPKEKALKIRYRIDGMLFEAMNPPHSMHAAIVSRLKIMANLDIAERRLPQDGRIRAMVQRPQDRPAHQHAAHRPRREGASSVSWTTARSTWAWRTWASVRERPDDLEEPDRPAARHPAGHRPDRLRARPPRSMPRCGRWTRSKLNISTVEDPVEYNLGAVNQVQVHEQDRHDLLRRPARPAAPGPRRDHAGRNPRRRDGPHRRAGRPDRPPGALARCTPTMPPRPSRG